MVHSEDGSDYVMFVNDAKTGKSLSLHDPLTGQFVDEVVIPTGTCSKEMVDLQRPFIVERNKVKYLYGSFIDKASGAINWFHV